MVIVTEWKAQRLRDESEDRQNRIDTGDRTQQSGGDPQRCRSESSDVYGLMGTKGGECMAKGTLNAHRPCDAGSLEMMKPPGCGGFQVILLV
jgi:hypothetical protein